MIGFAFDHAMTASEREEIEAAARLVSEMTGGALDRTRVIRPL